VQLGPEPHFTGRKFLLSYTVARNRRLPLMAMATRSARNRVDAGGTGHVVIESAMMR
jgi:hypothetical protein